MDECIYLRNQPNLYFNSQDHIIPAGIGGIKKLQLGIVSDEFNNMFSFLEQKFIRNSFVSLPRQFIGPGKRGSVSVKKESQSEVHVMLTHEKDNEPSLGYLQKGIPNIINQIKISPNKNLQLTLIPTTNVFEASNTFKKDLASFDGKYFEIIQSKISTGLILFGIHKGKWYLGRNKDTLITKLPETVASISDNLIFDDKLNYKYGSDKITSLQLLNINIIETFRVYAKIAFNVLAFNKGKDFVLLECFDEIRSWIVNGGTNKFATLLKQSVAPIPLSEKDSHYIIIIKIDSCLMAIVSLYGNNFQVGIKLSENFVDHFKMEIFVCDWKNKNEYDTLNYLNSISDKEFF